MASSVTSIAGQDFQEEYYWSKVEAELTFISDSPTRGILELLRRARRHGTTRHRLATCSRQQVSLLRLTLSWNGSLLDSLPPKY